MHALLWPDLIVLCGGITEEPEKFMDKLHCEARLCIGTLRSEAGIVGAALATTLRDVTRSALAAAVVDLPCAALARSAPQSHRPRNRPPASSGGHGRPRRVHARPALSLRRRRARRLRLQRTWSPTRRAAPASACRARRRNSSRAECRLPEATCRRAISCSCIWRTRNCTSALPSITSASFMRPPRGGRVRIDSLAAPPYARGFMNARRVIATP